MFRIRYWVFLLLFPIFIIACYVSATLAALSLVHYYYFVKDYWDDTLIIYTYKTGFSMLMLMFGDACLSTYIPLCKDYYQQVVLQKSKTRAD